MYLGVLEDEHIDLVIAFEELEIQLNGFLARENTSQIIIYCFHFLQLLWSGLAR